MGQDMITKLRAWISGKMPGHDAPQATQPVHDSSPKDRRRTLRYDIHLPVRFSGESITGWGMTRNVSMAGCAIESKTRVRPGACLRLEIQMPDDKAALAVPTAAVRWTIDNSFGTDFTELEPQAGQRLRRLLQQLSGGGTKQTD